jgi:hypothetical protein
LLFLSNPLKLRLDLSSVLLPVAVNGLAEELFRV